MIVNQAYRFALDPNAGQLAAFASHAGASRKAFNWALGLVKAQLDQRAAEKTYGLTAEQLTPSVSWTLPSLRKAWNQAKGEVAPWWAQNSKEAYAAGIRNLVRGLDAWRDSKSGKRKGPKVRFPKFKSKRGASSSVTFTTGVIRVEADRKHVTLPRLGRIKLHESARKLARRLDAGTARILSATVKLDGGRWYVSFSCEVDRKIGAHTNPGTVAGVDVGIKHLAVLSTGQIIDNPKPLAGAAKHLRRLSRRVSRRVGPDRRARQDPSNRWIRANAARSRAYARVANLRRDGLHKLTTSLAGEYATVVVEDLNAARNLALLVERESGTGVAGDPQPQGWNGRGADRKTPLAGPVAVKRPPRQGTVGRKRPTADRELTNAH
jgi:putative transposase